VPLAAPGPVAAFRLPFEGGESFTVTQGWNTPYSHNGLSAYAYDFALPAGTPVIQLEMQSGGDVTTRLGWYGTSDGSGRPTVN